MEAGGEGLSTDQLEKGQTSEDVIGDTDQDHKTNCSLINWSGNAHDNALGHFASIYSIETFFCF